MGAGAVGAIAGSLTVERLERHIPTKTLMAMSMVATATGFAVPAVLPNPYVAGGALALSGLGVAVYSVLSLSLRQELVPEGMLGRVSSGFRLIAFGARPLGAVLAGAVAAAIGLRPLFLLCAGTLLLTVPLIARLHTPERGHVAAASPASET